MMECCFAVNSPANGCRFEIVSQTTGNETIRNIEKKKTEDCASLFTKLDIPTGGYDVRVHDIVDGNITTESAFNISSYNHILRITGECF